MKRGAAIAALALGSGVIASASAFMGLFAWGTSRGIAVLVIPLFAAIGIFWVGHKLKFQLPPSLTPRAFAYRQPTWLNDTKRQSMSDLAKAAFVLLLFEQTETGCWGKSYLPRHLKHGETLPLALGAITGTPSP